MEGGGDADSDAVLSDIEGDDPAPIVINSSPPDDISVEKFRELLAKVDCEREAREAAEKSKSELQIQFNRLKVLAHDAIKKHDQCSKQRDEALREKEEALKVCEKLSGELAEAIILKDGVLKQKDDVSNQFEELMKARDSLRSEIETSTHMLVTGIEKVSGKVSNIKNFTACGLPKSQKYTGLSSVAYGVIKRANEIVEELIRQIDATTLSRNDIREQMEQRNYEIAIEVSQLEATINHLRGEVSEKTSALENLEKSIAEKDLKMNQVEKDLLERINLNEKEALELRQLVDEYEHKLKNLELNMESVRPLVINQLSFVSKIHDQVYHIIEIVDANKSDNLELPETMFLPQETSIEQNVCASLAGMESIFQLTRTIVNKTSNLVEERGREAKKLNETISQLIKEKEYVGSLLRGVLSKKITSKTTSRENDFFGMAENGMKESSIEFRFNDLLRDEKSSDSLNNAADPATEEGEIYTLGGALENIVKASQLEIINLQHAVEELRAECILLKENLEFQSKELSDRKHQIVELKEKERAANESIEGLMMDIAVAEEEIARWKAAAEQEAAAGRSIERELVAKMSPLHEELEEAKKGVSELEKKLKLKEETAKAAMAARDAAEKSLRLADSRAGSLRERVEELNRQVEECESRGGGAAGFFSSNGRYACWPWRWLGLDFVAASSSRQRGRIGGDGSNEMEELLLSRQSVSSDKYRRDVIDDEINAILLRLPHPNVGLVGNLIDAEGFPQSDIDVRAVCADRGRISELQNDYKQLTKMIDENISPTCMRFFIILID